MPMPRWWVHVNKRVFNPRAVASGTWPVLTHAGRSSGTLYRTPMDAYPVDGGYVFVPVYGPGSDWVRNVLVAGRAQLTVEGRDLELTAPRLIGGDEATRALGARGDAVARRARVLRIDTFLRMDMSAD